jgi:hypothetical protein
MHRVVLRGRRGPFAAFAALATAFVFSQVASAEPTRLLVFGGHPNTTVEVRKNGTLVTTRVSSGEGSVVVSLDVIAGDRLDVIGPDLQPPPPPLLTSLSSDDPSCATATWLPSGDPTVVGYVLSFGTTSVANGDATSYDQSIEVGNATSHTECALPGGTYYFAVQARNADGAMSIYSSERSVVITTLAVLISNFEAHAGEDGVRLSWRVEADEVVLGYRVYRSEGTGPEVLLTDQLLEPSTTSYVDDEARAGSSYTYFVAAIKENGDEVRSVTAGVTTPARTLALGQNYPNPFNPATKIPFTLDRSARVELRVFDVRGALVATIHDGTMQPGNHSIEWSGRDDRGRPVASGIYLYTLTTDKHTLSRKMVLMK